MRPSDPRLRGEPTEYSGPELGFIGMPIGGIAAGQLYLGGDGTLWLWDVFNLTPADQQPGGTHYTTPLSALFHRGVDQRFELRIDGDDARRILGGAPYGEAGFPSVTFRGQYPIGFVEYRDPACPVEVDLEAFSPFSPLDADASGLPATTLEFTIRNRSADVVSGSLTGLLENAVGRSANRDGPVERTARIRRTPGLVFLELGARLRPGRDYVDAGEMGIGLLAPLPDDVVVEELPDRPAARPAGSVSRRFALPPGGSVGVTFLVAWWFPGQRAEFWMNHRHQWLVDGMRPRGDTRRHYATRFDGAGAVATHLAERFDDLAGRTRLWHRSWYEDSTLPHWFLERTLLNAATLATETATRFADGRFYGSEGVGGGPGTCTHVWHYGQAMGRLFPRLDEALLELTDLAPGAGLADDGMVRSRGELDGGPAVDGQAGTILRALRRHQTSPDDGFLRRNWAAIRMATEWLIGCDADRDGLLDAPQPNTLDGTWYGSIAWLSGLYLAALAAAERMARTIGDEEFAEICGDLVATGRSNMVERLFTGEYFVNLIDPDHAGSLNSGTGCLIDQVLGQSWAFQLGLPRVLPEAETRSALRAIQRNNFQTDVGPFRARNPTGRWYAMPGEAGLVMCSFPDPDWTFERARGPAHEDLSAGYFNECMSGFEHQIAGHLIWEGLVDEGLAVERAIHDRYHAARRNPWNEVEAGDHYARAMASYGVFLAACGFEYDGPDGFIAFAPRVSPEDFAAAFTAAEGWGSFRQRIGGDALDATLELRWGSLRIRTLGLRTGAIASVPAVTVTRNGVAIPSRLEKVGDGIRIHVEELHLTEGDRLDVHVS